MQVMGLVIYYHNISLALHSADHQKIIFLGINITATFERQIMYTCNNSRNIEKTKAMPPTCFPYN